MPGVTVLMCVFNGERYLRAALESILAQTYRDFELLLVDDASSDASPEILAAFAAADSRVRVLRNEVNLGLTRSLNRGLALVRAPLVARQDADDLSHPRRLELQVRFLAAHPEIALLGTNVRIIDAQGALRGGMPWHRAESELGIEWQLLFSNPFTHSSVMFRTHVVRDELGGYDEAYEFNQDFELWSRLLERHRARNLPAKLVDYRAHAGSIAGRLGAEVLESRRANLARNLGVQRRNLARILGEGEGWRDWPELWSRMNVPWIEGHPPRPERGLALFRALQRRFLELHPAAAGDASVRRQSAQALAFLAAYLAPRHRLASLQSFAGAVRADAWALHLAPRWALLLGLGERRLGLIRSRRQRSAAV